MGFFLDLLIGIGVVSGGAGALGAVCFCINEVDKSAEVVLEKQKKYNLIDQLKQTNNKLYLEGKKCSDMLKDKVSELSEKLTQIEELKGQINNLNQQLEAQKQEYQELLEVNHGNATYHKKMMSEKDAKWDELYRAAKGYKDRTLLEHQKEIENLIQAHRKELEKVKADAVKIHDGIKAKLIKKEQELEEMKLNSGDLRELEIELRKQQGLQEVNGERLQNEWNRLEAEHNLFVQQYDEKFTRYSEKLESQNEQIEQLMQALMDSEVIEHENKELREIIDQLQKQLNEHTPKLPDDVIDIMRLLASEDIKTEFIDNQNRGGVEIYRFKPLTKISQSKLDSVCANIPAMFDWVEAGQSKARVTKGEILIEIDQSDKGERLFNQVRIDAEWVYQMLEDSTHIRLIGSTGDGKSTTANNILNCAVSMGYEAIIIDPKFYSPEHDGWIINGKEFRPQYRDEAECLGGIKTMLHEIFRRKAEVKKYKDAGLEVPQFTKQFYIIDEFVNLTEADEDNEIKSDLARVLREGRSFGIKCLYMGQEVNVTSYGKSKASAKNGSNIILKGLLNEALDRPDMGFNKRDTEAIKATIEEIEKRGYKYYGLVRITDSNWYLAVMPKPNYFDVADISTDISNRQSAISQRVTQNSSNPYTDKGTDNLTDASVQEKQVVTIDPYCPDCGSTKIVKNGKDKDGNQRYLCRASKNKNCYNKQFIL